MQLKDPRHYIHGQTKDGTYRLKRHALLDVRDAPVDYDNAAASSTDANPQWRNSNEDYAMGYQLHPKLSWTRDTLSLPGGVQHMSASGVSLSFHHMSHHLLTLAAGRFFLLFVFPVFFVWVLVFASCFASVMGFLIPPLVLNLDDRQGFTARSATQ